MSFNYWQSALDTRLDFLGESLSSDGDAPPRLTRMQLELEARAMRTMLSQVHASVNRLTPAHELPPAALHNIFLLLARLEPVPNATWGTRAREGSHWTKVLHVCRRYRQVALDCPELWTSPPLGLGSARFYAFVGRSKDAPLTLELKDDGELPLGLLRDLVNEPEDLARIAHLRSEQRLDEGTLQALTGAMDVLETLHIRPHLYPEDEEGKPSAMALPDGLLSGHASVLQTLVLRGFSTFFNQPAILSHVVSLDISRGVKEAAYTRPSWSDVFSVLGSLPCARTIALHGCLPLPPKDTAQKAGTQRRMIEGPGQGIIDLQHVTDIDISGKLDSVATLFEQVALVPACRIHLKFEFSADGSRRTGRLSECLARAGFLPPRDAPANFFHAARVLHWEYAQKKTRLQIATWLEDAAAGAARDAAALAAPAPFVLEFDNLPGSASLEVLESLGLPLGALQTLYLGPDTLPAPPASASSSSPSPMAQRATLALSLSNRKPPHAQPLHFQCPQLTTLYAEGQAAKSMLKALESAAVYPVLRRLVVARGVDFEDDYKEELMITWKVLQRTLGARTAAGVPLQFVALHPQTLKDAYWVEKLADSGTSFEAADVAEVVSPENARWSGAGGDTKKTDVLREY